MIRQSWSHAGLPFLEAPPAASAFLKNRRSLSALTYQAPKRPLSNASSILPGLAAPRHGGWSRRPGPHAVPAPPAPLRDGVRTETQRRWKGRGEEAHSRHRL